MLIARERYRHRMEIAERIAEALLEGFDRHYRLFRDTSAKAKDAFDAGDWVAVQRLVKERIRFYDERVLEYVERLARSSRPTRSTTACGSRRSSLYVGLLIEHKRPELAETFFNSVTTRVLRRTYIHDDLMFMRAAVSTEYIPSDPPRIGATTRRSPACVRRSCRSFATSAGAGRSRISSATSST